MRKALEISTPGSCINSALPEEMVFVLLGRDACAPEVVRFWARKRIESGKNTIDDPEIREALDAADVMEDQREKVRRELGK